MGRLLAYFIKVFESDRGIKDALTADDHFRQAGFTVLLGDAVP